LWQIQIVDISQKKSNLHYCCDENKKTKPKKCNFAADGHLTHLKSISKEFHNDSPVPIPLGLGFKGVVLVVE